MKSTIKSERGKHWIRKDQTTLPSDYLQTQREGSIDSGDPH